jgi:hypothetical protein
MKVFILFVAQLGILGSLQARDCFFEKKHFQEENFFTLARFYPVEDSTRTIIILPPTGGTNILDRSYARQLCAHGFNVYILDKYTGFDEYNLDLDIHRRYYGRTQRAIDSIVKDVPDHHTLSIMGTSVGAIHAAISAGRIERIRNALIITGGADVAGLIVDSDQEIMRVAREKRNKMFGFKTRDDYYNELKKHIELDPLNYETNFLRKKISMVIADKDTTVPHIYQRLLRKISQPAHILEMNDNHFWAIVKTWLFHQDFVVKSFQ